MEENDRSVTAEINLYYDLYIPEGLSTPAPLLIAVHGYGAHKRYMMREARLVADDRFVIVSIQAPHPHFRKTADGYRVGYGWLAGENSDEDIRLHHRFVMDVVESLDRDGLIDADRVFMYGFSQACALDFRFAFTHPELLAGVIGACGGIPGDIATNENYRAFNGSVLYLYGDDDEFYSREQLASFDKQLRERLPDYTSKPYQAKHEITDEMRADIATWLREKAKVS